MSALRKSTYSHILRPSAAMTKLRAAYSRPPQVAIAGLFAGIGAFLSPLIIYMIGAVIADSIKLKGMNFHERTAWLINYFGIHVTKGIGAEKLVINYLVLLAIFGAIGIFSAFIYKMATVSEGSLTFFERKFRLPFEIIPFFATLIHPFEKALDLVLRFAVAVLIAIIWKFYYAKVLSVVSTVDVSKIIPNIDLK